MKLLFFIDFVAHLFQLGQDRWIDLRGHSAVHDKFCAGDVFRHIRAEIECRGGDVVVIGNITDGRHLAVRYLLFAHFYPALRFDRAGHYDVRADSERTEIDRKGFDERVDSAL